MIENESFERSTAKKSQHKSVNLDPSYNMTVEVEIDEHGLQQIEEDTKNEKSNNESSQMLIRDTAAQTNNLLGESSEPFT